MYSVVAVIVVASLAAAAGQDSTTARLGTADGQQTTNVTTCSKREWRCLDSTCIARGKKCDGPVDCPDSSDETTDACGTNKCKENQFRCTYGGCVHRSSVCDDAFDCADWSDEHRSLCPNNTICGDNKELFQCQYSSACIPGDWICDGVAQCPEDKTDESLSTCMNNTCADDMFRCAYGACVEKDKVCDGSRDCHDASDETPSLCKDNVCPDDKFRCAYGACVYKFFLCDASNDCLDGSDEVRSVCPNAPCKPDQFRCESDDKCLAQSKVCNGAQDCEDNSDEFSCPDKICADGQFKCGYGACIDQSLVCNGQSDCADATDENYATCSNRTCQDWQFRCAYGACINDVAKCNGHRGCADGSDELYSLCQNVTCDIGQFRCAYGPCVSVLEVCDGKQDCADNSDEQQPQCRFVEYNSLKCQDGSTTLSSFACDGDTHCADGSDETELMCAGYACHAGQFQCAYGACLTYGTKCDGREQCADKSDETYELCKDNRCRDNQFRCAYGGCVDKGFACDGRPSCADGSDELESVCSNRTCKDDQFQCAYGACIPKDSVCDGRKDCVDGSDELPDQCRNNTCAFDQFRCNYGACVSRYRVCDGDKDCVDNSDEEVPLCQHVNNNRFTCDDGDWIDTGKLCNGVTDCVDKSDETARVCVGSVCHAAQTRCAYGACHINATKCDGIEECLDGYDEAYEVCGKVRCILPEYPEHGRYSVSSGGAAPGASLETAALTILCNEGFTVDSSDAVFCNNGVWSVPTFPKCVRYCTLPNDPSVAYRCLDSESPSEESRPCRERELSGAVALPSCNGPNFYSTHALPHMTCVEGFWDKIANCTTVCGRVTPNGKRLIAGGRDAVYGELPWHAGIYRKSTNYEQICGGSLVSENVVVSAAHCFWEYDLIQGKFLQQPATNYAVAVGKLYRRWRDQRDLDAQRSNVKQILLPKEYEGQAKNHQADIAVVIVTRAFEYHTHVRPVCLSFDVDFDNAQLHEGNKGKVAGWGRSGQNARESPRLQTVELPYVTTEECDLNSPQDFKEYITFDKFCAGFWKGGIAVCKGDSGGGLTFPESYNGVDRYFLRGIVSTAPKNDDACNVDVYTTMTHILKHQQFITQNL